MGENLQYEKKNNSWIVVLLGIIVMLAMIVLAIIFLLQGKTTSVNGDNITAVQSITCENDNAVYPFFTSDGTDSHSLKVNTILNDDRLSSISLIYKLYYGDAASIEHGNTNLHAAMNTAFGADGLGADALGATYSSLSDSAQMALYTEARAINGATAKYFLLENANGDYKKDTIMKVYSDNGFSCVIDE